MALQALRTTALAVLLLSVSSCGLDALYDAQVILKESKWFKDEAVRFEVLVKDTAASYDFILTIRNNTEYRFSNLYVFLITRFPNGNLTRDTIECILADHTGKWLGKGWGNIKDNRITLKSGLRFPLKGKYEFLVQQAMRADTLKHITSVGLRIENTDE